MTYPSLNTPTQRPADPLPNPEPASPSLDQPDPGVFHHDPVNPLPPDRHNEPKP